MERSGGGQSPIIGKTLFDLNILAQEFDLKTTPPLPIQKRGKMQKISSLCQLLDIIHIIHIILFPVSSRPRISSWEGKDDKFKNGDDGTWQKHTRFFL